jgi:hypothetical protein
MCWALYAASDVEIPLVPWDKRKKKLGVLPVGDSDNPIRAKFGLPNIVYVASHEGCGCGFMGDAAVDDEVRLRSSVLHELYQMLTSIQAAGGTLEMFLCWEGEQGDPPESCIELTTDSFLADAFPMREGQLAIVR